MNLYAFELGRKKELCLAELKSVLGEKNLIETNLDTAIFQLNQLNKDQAQELQNKLGGTIKIIEIFYKIQNFNPNSFKKDLFALIEAHLSDIFRDRTGKIPFSVCQLNYKKNYPINSKEILNFSKKILKSLNLNSRFVNKDHKNPRPSTIFKAKVLTKGIDLNIIGGEKEVFIGETIAIQDINAYSERDYDKPARDSKVGMTPPKLAQIMINLAGTNETIYDPFCGTGTFMIEALLMGKNALGSDISQRLVEYSQTNCNWISKVKNITQKWSAYLRDARFINTEELPANFPKIDAIITEGYLGEPVRQLPKPEDREKTFRELANLHLNWLRAANTILESKAKIVMCLAAFNNKGNIEKLPNFQEIVETAGFTIKDNYLYERSRQIVLREIYILEKK